MNETHDHDLDLIAALAEGSLEHRDEAEAQVAGCAECRAEFSAQRRALEALSSVASFSITDVERTRLRTAVWGGLDRRAPVVPLRARRPWWVPAGAVAAGMLALVGVIAFLRPVGGETSEQAFGANAASLGAPAATTAAAATTEFMTAEAPFDARSAKREILPGGNATELGRQLRDLLDRLAAEGSAPLTDYDTADKPCLDQVDEDVLAIVETTLDERPMIVYVTSGVEGPSARAFDPDTCDAVEVVIPD